MTTEIATPVTNSRSVGGGGATYSSTFWLQMLLSRTVNTAKPASPTIGTRQVTGNERRCKFSLWRDRGRTESEMSRQGFYSLQIYGCSLSPEGKRRLAVETYVCTRTLVDPFPVVSSREMATVSVMTSAAPSTAPFPGDESVELYGSPSNFLDRGWC